MKEGRAAYLLGHSANGGSCRAWNSLGREAGTHTLGPILLLSRVLQQGAGEEVEQSGFEPVLI